MKATRENELIYMAFYIQHVQLNIYMFRDGTNNRHDNYSKSDSYRLLSPSLN